jgi:catechol 2,3-dioxygenase
MTTEQGPIVPTTAAEEPIDPGTRIGHVHLRTADIDRIRDFYVGVLGFDVIAEARDVSGWGTTGDILFVSAGGYHHHLGFNTWLSKDGEPTPDGVTGLHHVAIAYPTRRALADAYRRLKRADWPIRQAESYSTHDAIYIIDPDGNTLELMWDKPPGEWARTPEGHQAMVFGEALDLDGLLRELDGS